jgi:hypothetical protein
VNHSAGPLPDGCEPLLLISMSIPLRDQSEALSAFCAVTWLTSAPDHLLQVLGVARAVDFDL